MRKPLFESVHDEPKPPELRWRIAKDEEVRSQPLVLAGKPIALYTHRVGRRTLPCMKSLPMLAWECPHCERSAQKKCWVPIININMNPHAPELRVIMGATTLEASVQKVKPGTLIAVKKVLHLKPTWAVFEEGDQSMQAVALGLIGKYVPERGDITRWLLHYWQWPELTRAFGEVYRLSLSRKLHEERAEQHKLSLMTGDDAAG